MEPLQFTLFFVALLVGYVLVHLRLVRFEEHLQKLAGIRGLDDRLRSLDDRLQKVSEAFGKVSLERIEQHLERLHEDLVDLREATGEVRHAVVQIPTPTVQAADNELVLPPARHESPAERVVGLVENRLLQLGYRKLRLLSDLGDAAVAGEMEVQVECERRGMPVKGRVVLRNGSVHDIVLQPVTQMFP
ncbi:MAG: hypothetical protein H6835_12830 [Planctomycetes bacterium]|nr:hypothetical protein [Planctomycetota bacterium]